MRVPIGDAKTRHELLLSNPNMAAAREGFLEGRNHPDDIDGMISLFVNFAGVSYIEKAIDVWGKAQAMALQLLPIGNRLYAEIQSPAPSQDKINALLGSVYTINEQLTALEDEFSYTLGEGSRWLERVVLRLLFLTALTVETTGLLLTVSVSRGIRKGLTNIISAANSFSSGELSARAKVLSRDEIGVVASSFNDMAANHQKRVGELDEVNRHLTREISERERAEAMLRQSENMRALGQLTGGIAHDFNNLLGVIIGSAEFLTDALRDMPEHSELAHEILNTALNGSLLTRRLLAVGRNQPLQPQCVDLGALLSGEVDMLRRTLPETIQIEVMRAPNLWFTGADPSRIGDALLNLALNARDAMPQGGKLTIRAANMHLDGRDTVASRDMTEGDYVILTLSDTGTGMPASVLEKAIEPFFTTKPPSVGTGLGLSMVYGFAKQSGGHLDIQSTVGAGTTVRLILPRARGHAPAVSGAPRAPAAHPTGTEAILLVDDNQTLMEVTRRSLSAWGYKVIAATGGQSALTILESDEPIDLLFTDVVMPGGVSGPELAASAQHLRPGLKILFTTGYASDQSEQHGHCTLHKPYDRRELARTVRLVLDGLAAAA